MSLPIYNSTSMSSWDSFTILNEPITSLDLMERAASLATKQILANNLFNSVSIICGPGNNGGDGLVIARLLHECGKKIELFYIDSKDQTEDFKKNFKKLPQSLLSTKISETFDFNTFKGDLVIDCIFGSGLNRPIEGWIAKVVQAINKSHGQVISIDIPSGLFAQGSQNEKNVIVKAKKTLTFMSPKITFLFAENDQYVGDLKILDIQLNSGFDEKPLAHFLGKEDISVLRRNKFDHKGIAGYLTIIAGSDEMPGAAILASRSAIKSGAGYVNLISSNGAIQALMCNQPEVICQLNSNYLISEKTNAITIGPGIGILENSVKLVLNAFKRKLPIIVDADAISIIAKNDQAMQLLPKNAILTPHLGELKKLIGNTKDSNEILDKQLEFSMKNAVYIIQKGAYSKLTCPDGEIFINSTGNPGMASAGMGDVLSGLIGSLLAQGYSPKESCKLGMYIHGFAADQHAFQNGEIGLLASDVIERLPSALHHFSS